MTREEKQDHLAETLNIRPSTASIAVDMLEQQKMFLAAIARNEYNRGVTDALEIVDRNVELCGSKYRSGDFMPDVYALLVVRKEFEALKEGDQE